MGATKQQRVVVVVQEVAEVALPHSHRRPFEGSACSELQGAIISLYSSWTTFPF